MKNGTSNAQNQIKKKKAKSVSDEPRPKTALLVSLLLA